ATKLPGGMVFSSLMMYLFLYVTLIIAYIWAIFYMARQADKKSTQTLEATPIQPASTSLQT
ncbi:MAG: cytochrome ubiquinol oxidase subunit I, partial [Burkholderiaceae bacterium]|nr:cytochrome ubiquinol oxidase subunit I [Burkholderiaceae bacterium]